MSEYFPPVMHHPSPRHPVYAIGSGAPSPASTPTQAAQLPLELQSYCVIGGGTGVNSFVGAFSACAHTSYILPISDDGGSSSEIQRVLGGPSVGDLRSRLVRLIPDSPPSSPLFAIRKLLEYRLDGSSSEVKHEWHLIVEGKHQLWSGVPTDRKECIRAFLVHFESAVLRKAQRGFSYRRASIGNLLLAGAFLFLGSIPSAIFLFASITEIPHERFRVIPVINTSSTATIAAELENGAIIAGQSEISHPPPPSLRLPPRVQTPALRTPAPQTSLLPPSPGARAPSLTSSYPVTRSATPALFEARTLGEEEDEADLAEEDRNPNVGFSKFEVPELEARIKRIFFLNMYGNGEVYPRANPLYLDSLASASCLIYSAGSLYTSIIPCLCLRGVGDAIATSPTLRRKVLFLNSTLDRETPQYSALDFVSAIVSTCNASYGEEDLPPRRREAKNYVTHLLYIEGGDVEVDTVQLNALGIQLVPVAARNAARHFDEQSVREGLAKVFEA